MKGYWYSNSSAYTNLPFSKHFIYFKMGFTVKRKSLIRFYTHIAIINIELEGGG